MGSSSPKAATGTCSSTSLPSSVPGSRPSMKTRRLNTTLSKTAANSPRKTSRSPNYHDPRRFMMIPPAQPGDFFFCVPSFRQWRDQRLAAIGPTLDTAEVAFKPQPAARQQPQRLRIDAVLDGKNSRRQYVGGVVITHGHRALHYDGAGVGLGNHEMHGRAGNLHARLQRLAMRVEARERRQQRGMDVEHPAIPALHELGREQPHEAAQTNQLDAMLPELLLQHRLERAAVLAERLALDDLGRDAAGFGALEAGGLRTVGNHHGDFGWIVLGSCGFDQRGHVRSAPGDQDGDAAFHQSARSR